MEETDKVYAASSLEDVREVLLSFEAKDLRSAFLKAANRAWVITANFLLKILKFFLFKEQGIEKREFKKIVVYTAGVLGDNIVRLSAIANLKNRYPNATITVIICTGIQSTLSSDLYRNLPYVDNCVILSEQILNSISCDLFVNFSGSANIGHIRYLVREMLYAYKMDAQCAIGFYITTYGLKKFLRHVQHLFIENEPLRYCRVLEELELNPITNLNILPEDSEARESLLSKLKCKDNEFWAVMIPGGSKQCKLWPLERFGAVANWLGKHYSARIFLTGNVTERDIAEQIRIMAKDYVVNVAGETTIQELIEILRVSRVCITNDSGAMHIAAILKTPTVAVFNTHVPPTWWFPDNDKIIQIFSMCECSYCNMFYCDSKKCLGNITVEHVIEAVARLLLKNDQVGLSVPLNAAEMAKEI